MTSVKWARGWCHAPSWDRYRPVNTRRCQYDCGGVSGTHRLTENETTAGLVAAARRGDGGAFDRLYRRFMPVVHGILLGIVAHADVEDVAQRVFVTAFGRLADLREDAAFPGWIARMARRAGVDARRRNVAVTGLEIDAVATHASHEDRVDAARALQAIRSLPEAYREPLLLRLVEGLSGPEIAEMTGMTPGSVRVNLHRGMALLRQALAEPDGRGVHEFP